MKKLLPIFLLSALGLFAQAPADGAGKVAVYGPSFNGTAPAASTVTITNDTTTNATMYPTWVTATSGNLPLKVSSTKFTANPSTGLWSVVSLAASSLTSGRLTLAGASGLLTDDSDLTFDGISLKSLGYSATSNTTTYGATTTIDLRNNLQTVSLTGNVTFATSNRAAGIYCTVRVICDSTIRTLTFPSWVFVGTVAPANISASKTAILSLICFGTAETDVVATWVQQP